MHDGALHAVLSACECVLYCIRTAGRYVYMNPHHGTSMWSSFTYVCVHMFWIVILAIPLTVTISCALITVLGWRSQGTQARLRSIRW